MTGTAMPSVNGTPTSNGEACGDVQAMRPSSALPPTPLCPLTDRQLGIEDADIMLFGMLPCETPRSDCSSPITVFSQHWVWFSMSRRLGKCFSPACYPSS